ncbi:TRAP transporter large permease [Paracoccus sp. SCSIO 75233]|uniref:TRAP transporter large permease n=1 Tax=Paracoccus sp. SCSIO 75233 TaxID=3017782 RepID=UPI0022F0DB0D|nr:TRAP transporter large permease subunit [Paracoccus sp. SCSIO 75233]WBU52429.1 TRAP transporter large permease subunit [Paracoccus sp. SCSIO 75233]
MKQKEASMDRFEIGLAGVAVTFLLVIVRVPISVALATTSFVGLWILTNLTAAFGMLKAVPYQFIANWSFSSVPMFLLMGFVASRAGLTSGLFRLMRVVLYRIPGGLACSTVGACALFAAASGSSVATAAGMGRIAIPEMRKAGYAYSLSAGCVAASGTLGSLIPPSVVMIMYGIFAQAPIGKLFIAGVIPGILTAVAYIAMIVIAVKIKPEIAPAGRERLERGNLKEAVLESWPLPVLVIGVIGGIYSGIMTPTEAGAVGASLACIIAISRKSLTRKVVSEALSDTALGTSRLFLIAMGASMFTTFMGLAGLPSVISDFFAARNTDALSIILMVAVLYIVLGMFMDSLGIMLLTLPILIPILQDADVNLIWFGILVVKLLEIGLVSPPFGLNVYVIHSLLRGAASLPTIFKGALMFLAMDILVVAAMIIWPEIALWLPENMN